MQVTKWKVKVSTEGGGVAEKVSNSNAKVIDRNEEHALVFVHSKCQSLREAFNCFLLKSEH